MHFLLIADEVKVMNHGCFNTGNSHFLNAKGMKYNLRPQNIPYLLPCTIAYAIVEWALPPCQKNDLYKPCTNLYVLGRDN